MFNARIPKLSQTWVEVDGEICGAKDDERGPIGGGEGYTGTFTQATDGITTLDELFLDFVILLCYNLKNFIIF